MNPVFKTDAYKVSHKKFETEGTKFVQANFTPRSFRLAPINIDKAVVFGTQRMVKRLVDMWDKEFFNRHKDDVINEAYRVFSKYLGMKKDDLEHFGKLHDLGYLPLEFRGLPEGTLVSEKMPILLMKNTHEDFSWLVTYLETWISTEMWLPMTSATTIYHFRKLVNEWAVKTMGSTDGTEFQLHDFSYRGMGPDEAGASGAGFLLSSLGTDSIPAIIELETYYNTDIDKEPIAFSVPATEHSVTCVGIAVNGEIETMRKWITEDYPTGIVSIVSDTLDYWKVITEYAKDLKDDILNRVPNEVGLAKVVFRPDSGDPVKVLTGYMEEEYYVEEDGTCISYGDGKELSEAEIKGSVECLWDIFGGTKTEQGYKVLHERVGLIYGDSITYEKAQQIFERLEKKGFASLNVVLGVGSYTMRYVTRDSLGSAVKVTWAKVGAKSYPVSKDPITDSGVKKSAHGFLDVVEDDGELKLIENQDEKVSQDSAMIDYLNNGIVSSCETLSGIRERMWG